MLLNEVTILLDKLGILNLQPRPLPPELQEYLNITEHVGVFTDGVLLYDGVAIMVHEWRDTPDSQTYQLALNESDADYTPGWYPTCTDAKTLSGVIAKAMRYVVERRLESIENESSSMGSKVPAPVHCPICATTRGVAIPSQCEHLMDYIRQQAEVDLIESFVTPQVKWLPTPQEI